MEVLEVSIDRVQADVSNVNVVRKMIYASLQSKVYLVVSSVFGGVDVRISGIEVVGWASSYFRRSG